MNIRIRKFAAADAQAVSALIIHTIRVSNARDYPAALLEEMVEQQQPENVLQRAGWTHFYVAEDGERIIGCGAIGPYWGREDESSLFTVFVLPEYQGKGIGRQIVAALEQDEFFLRARRVEVPASITGLPFYRKLGYDFKGGNDRPDEERLYRLEKFRPDAFPDGELIAFLIRAKKATYAGKGAETAPSRPGAHDLVYREGSRMYYDSYLGGEKFAGEEALWVDGVPCWSMNYAGRVTGAPFSGDFLKAALLRVPAELPFRGPAGFSEGDYSYACEVNGCFSWFQGKETICLQGREIYECYFHGGQIRQ